MNGQPAPVISVATRKGALYPSSEGWFSPSEKYPEWHEAPVPVHNDVYGMLRELFDQAGLDAGRVGSGAWNPLGAYIRPGSRVFVLCNFVYHRRPSESVEDFLAKCIHGSVLRALLDYLLKAAGPEGEVSFGNASLQSCEWERVLKETGADVVQEFYRARSIAVMARDLRLHVMRRNRHGAVEMVEERGAEDLVTVDLAEESLLAEIAGGGARFRVSNYDPRRTEACHKGGSHKYLVHRAVLESDVVVSLSKLKTHEKVGVTCGLKGFVGAVAHKDCLAHHRFGTPSAGGDEYSRDLSLLNYGSRFHDWVHMRSAGASFQAGFQIADRYMRAAMRRIRVTPAGGWHGNDTAWRMSLDLARILHFASADGVLQDAPQRTHLSLIDGIIGGEGDGPLIPTAIRSEALLFSDDVAIGDRVACRLMGFDPSLVPLIRRAFEPMPHALPAYHGSDAPVVFNGKHTLESALPAVAGRPFRPPLGWRQHLAG